jgi:hypothetical protein
MSVLELGIVSVNDKMAYRKTTAIRAQGRRP